MDPPVGSPEEKWQNITALQKDHGKMGLKHEFILVQNY